MLFAISIRAMVNPKFQAKLLGRTSTIGALILLVLIGIFAYWLYMEYKSGGTVTIFGMALPAWLVYGVAGAIVIAIIAKFIQQTRPLQPLPMLSMKMRGSVNGFLALIMIFLAMIIVVTYVLGYFGLSWSTVISYSALALAVLVIIVLAPRGGRHRGVSGVTIALILIAIAAIGAAIYYAHYVNNVTYALYASIAAIVIAIIAVFMHRHKGEEVVVLEE